MNTFLWNGREYALDQLTAQQKLLLEAVIESENKMRQSERIAFLDRMAHEGARGMFVSTLMSDQEIAQEVANENV